MIYKFEIDVREKEFINENVINKLKEVNTNVYKKTLDVGDFIMYEGVDEVIIIERKEIKDFAASIIDGRYHEQHSRLMKIKGANPKTRIAYIVENYQALTDDDLKKPIGSTRITYETVLSSMTKLMFRDNISVIRSNGIDDTIKWLYKIWSNIVKQQFNPKTEEQTQHEIVNARLTSYKKSNTIEDWWLASLSQIYGMSPAKAKSVASVYPDVYSLIKAYDSCTSQADREGLISKIESNNRAIGWNVSLKVYQSIYGTHKPINTATTSAVIAATPVVKKQSRFSKKTRVERVTPPTPEQNCLIASDSE